MFFEFNMFFLFCFKSSRSYLNQLNLLIDVCAIRLDFESFTLASGTTFHDAATPLDTFQITTVSFFYFSLINEGCNSELPTYLDT